MRPNAAGRAASPEERLRTIEQVDRISTLLIHAGVQTVKKYPVPSALYVIGLLLCLFFNGWSVTESQYRDYDNSISTIDHSKLDDLGAQLRLAHTNYYNTKGWFSCDSTCQTYKRRVDELSREHQQLKAQYAEHVSSAKSKLGLFSAFGIDETRDLFWSRFTQGKEFATRQSKWDALFIGLRSMGRDETMVSYILRVLMQVLMNFTIGMIGTVISFIWSLYALIQSYKANILVALTFFAFASLAALAFAMTWLIGMYLTAAGTVYVGARLIAANMRLEDGPGGAPRQRMEYAQHHYRNT